MTMPNFCINFLNKAAKSLSILYDFAVASLADAWIKITGACLYFGMAVVASLADAWIKIDIVIANVLDIIVASLADAWIKMLSASLPHLLHAVASLADAWIKMEQQKVYLNNTKVRIPLPQ